MVHSFYSSAQPSGENTSVLQEVAALRRGGHDVGLFATHTDVHEAEKLNALRAGARVATGLGRDPLAEIEGFSPDIVHIQNLFPNYGRRWVTALSVPMVYTLRNYRPICANGLLFRDDGACTLCPDGNRLAGLRFGCYRGSRLATLPLTIANSLGPTRDPVIRRADGLVLLTELQKQLYVSAGLPPERIRIHPNFLSERDAAASLAVPATRFVVVGRLAPEKGILRLAEVWPSGIGLDIIGEGPDRPAIECLKNPDIRVHGQLEHTETLQVISRSRALIFPSLWYETFGRTALESWACATPVIATPGNTVELMINAHGGGAVVPWEELPDVVGSRPFTAADRAEARQVFEDHYTEQAFLHRAESLYSMLASTAGRRAG